VRTFEPRNPHSFLELVVVSGRKPRFGAGSTRWRRPRQLHFIASIVFGDTVWRSYFAFLRCPPMSKFDLQPRNVRCRRCPKTVPSSEGCVGHPLLLMVRRQGKFSGSGCSLERASVGQDAALLINFGHALLLCSCLCRRWFSSD
jgi:hypothetical protein